MKIHSVARLYDKSICKLWHAFIFDESVTVYTLHVDFVCVCVRVVRVFTGTKYGNISCTKRK